MTTNIELKNSLSVIAGFIPAIQGRLLGAYGSRIRRNDRGHMPVF